MDGLFQDIRYAVRSMFKNPGFTAVAIVSLALGIGANTSIFSVVNAILLKPLPYKNPEQLAQVFREYEQADKGIESSELWSYPKFAALRDNNDSFEQLAAVSSQNFPVTDSDSPERLSIEIVSGSYFPMLGVDATVGRTFTADEDQTPGANPVALIGHSLWQRRFGSDPGVIGKTISLNKVLLTIVGVLPEGFKGQKGTAEVWVPMMMAPQLTFPRRLATAFAHWTEVIGRLKPGVSVAQAQSEMGLVAAKVGEAVPIPAQLAGKMASESFKLTSLRQACKAEHLTNAIARDRNWSRSSTRARRGSIGPMKNRSAKKSGWASDGKMMSTARSSAWSVTSNTTRSKRHSRLRCTYRTHSQRSPLLL